MKDWIPVLVALVAALAALGGYLVNGRLNRISDKRKAYAEALAAVERYKQLPYTIYRLHDWTPETRAQLARLINETQENLAFHRRWLDLDSPLVGSAYNKLVDKVRETNGQYRLKAFEAPPPNKDGDMEGLDWQFYTHSFEERNECMFAMRRELRLIRWPLR